MLDDLKKVFAASWQSFRDELERREPAEQVAELLGAMRREMVDARVALKELDEALQRAQAELAGERKLLEQCERRGRMARDIDDAETAQVADQFAERHRERVGVLQQKAEALAAEQRLRQAEVEQMKRRYQDADRNRFALLAQLRRARARQGLDQALGGETDTFAEFSRMEQEIEGGASYADALREMAADEPAPPPAPDVDQRLEELKRRMRRE